MLRITSPGILVPLGFFALVGYIVYLNVRRKEREAMIKNGFHPDRIDNEGIVEPRKEHSDGHPTFKNVKSGFVLIGVGLGFFITKILIYEGVFDDTFSSYFSLVSLFGGIGLVGSYYFIQNLQKNDTASGKKDKDMEDDSPIKG